MKYAFRRHFIVGTLVLAVLLGGCLGLTKKPVAPQPQPTNVSGTVSAPVVAGSSAVSAMDVSGSVPIPGATVQALALPDLNPIGNPTTTDANGNYTITGLPEGIAVIVMATKAVEGGTLRVTTYVPEVQKNTTANADPATSLAAEILAERVRNGQTVTTGDWTAALANAESVVEELDEIDLRVGKSLVAPTIGSGLVDVALGDRILPPDPNADEPTTNVAKAKALVRAVRDAGYSLQSTFETQMQTHSESMTNDVGPTVRQVGEGLARLFYGYEGVVRLMADELPSGEYLCDHPGECVPGTGSTQDEEWVLRVDEIWTYQGIVEHYSEGADDPTTMYVAVYDDWDGGTPVHEATVTILYVEPAGAEVGIEAQLAAGTPNEATAVGQVNMSFFPDTDLEDGIIEEIHFSGTIESDAVQFNGYAEFTFEWASDSEYWVTYLDHFEAQGLFVTPTLEIDGTVHMDFVHRDSEHVASIPSYISVLGSMTDTTTEITVLTGSLEIVIDDPEAIEPEGEPAPDNWSSGSVQFTGSVESAGEAPIEVDITIIAEQWGQLNAEVAYERSGQTLTGTAVIVYDPELEVTVDLTDDQGLRLNLTYADSGGADGQISLQSETLATISVTSSGISVDYMDGTYHSLF